MNYIRPMAVEVGAEHNPLITLAVECANRGEWAHRCPPMVGLAH